MEDNKVNTIGKEFSMRELIKFVAAPVLSKLVISLLQTIDDSLFISRYCGKNALAAFTIALPWFMLMDAVIMVICAVSSHCSMLMGEKKDKQAKASFTSMVIFGLIIGCFFTLILSFFRNPILRFLGATDVLLPYVSTYMNISRFYIPLMIVANIFMRFYVVAGKPKVAVFSTFVQIFCNLFFDYLLIAKLNWGIVGAAYGNFAGNILLCLIGIIFYSNKNHEMHFVKPLNNPTPMLKHVWQLGRSQGLNSIAVSVSCFIANNILLNLGGETLVAGYAVVNNVQFMFMNAFFGLIASISPIVSYAYGEKNPEKLAKILKKEVILVESLSLIIALLIFLFKNGFIFLYFGNDTDETIRALASYGLNVVPYCYWVFSFNVMVQDCCIAVGNHRAATFLSIIENIVFANLTIILLPRIFGTNAIWYVFLVQELCTFVFAVYIAYINQDVYGYGKHGIATFMDR